MSANEAAVEILARSLADARKLAEQYRSNERWAQDQLDEHRAHRVKYEEKIRVIERAIEMLGSTVPEEVAA